MLGWHFRKFQRFSTGDSLNVMSASLSISLKIFSPLCERTLHGTTRALKLWTANNHRLSTDCARHVITSVEPLRTQTSTLHASNHVRKQGKQTPGQQQHLTREETKKKTSWAITAAEESKRRMDEKTSWSISRWEGTIPTEWISWHATRLLLWDVPCLSLVC